MSIYVNAKFRIRRNLYQEEAMKKLVEAKIFAGYKDILMISAIIGYNNKVYTPITKPAQDRVLMQFFSQRDYDIFDLIAYSHTKSQAVIKSDEKYEIFSAYANAGFPILWKTLGLDSNQVIDTNRAHKALIQYYTSLLTNDFFPEDESTSDLSEINDNVFLQES